MYVYVPMFNDGYSIAFYDDPVTGEPLGYLTEDEAWGYLTEQLSGVTKSTPGDHDVVMLRVIK